jgi:hypothetical protein
VLATPISACCTANKEEDTSSSGPTSAPNAIKPRMCEDQRGHGKQKGCGKGGKLTDKTHENVSFYTR